VLATPLTVVFFDFPPQLRDLIQQALEAEGGVRSETAKPGELAEAVERTRPDAVIMPLEAGDPQPEGRRFLEERVRLKVLGVGVRDGRSILYELCPRKSELGEAKPDEAAAMVRAALARQVVV
jgi:DNA-binding NarL/FixJ family response regulator